MGEWESKRVGEWESGRKGEWEKKQKRGVDFKKTILRIISFLRISLGFIGLL
jgi:hypothetical protein